MGRALWLLIGLQAKGWLRFLTRNLRSVRGALLAGIGLLVFLPWLLTKLLSGDQGFPREGLLIYGPAFLIVYCLSNVLFSSGERAVYFTPAEVNFLFSGPFGRRQLLGYKIVYSLMVGLPTTLLMAVFIQVRGEWFPAAYVGLLEMFLFMQLFGMCINLVAVTLGTHLYSRARKLFLAVVLVLAAVVALRAGGSPAGWKVGEWGPAFLASPVWQRVSVPLGWFFQAFVATRLLPGPDGEGLLVYAFLGALVDLGLVGVVFALDAQYLEAAAASSARIYVRLQRLRGRNIDAGEGATGRRARFGIPDLPWWGGIGPIFWRQLTAALRGLGRVVVVLAIVGMVLVPVLLGGDLDTAALPFLLMGGVLWLTIFLTAVVPFDFRGDVDRIAVLKTLPLPAWRLAIGQLLTPVVLLSVMQWLALAGIAAASNVSERFVLACAAFALPFNFLLFGLENLLFLLFPTRLMAATPGDFQAIGRNVLFLMGKMLGLGIVMSIALAVGFATWALTGYNVTAGLLAAWPVVALAGLALVPLIAFAFARFDVGRDTPP